jgi:hypothetical protein
MTGWGIKVKPYGCSSLATLTPHPVIAQPEGGDAEERRWQGSPKELTQFMKIYSTT